MDVNKFMKLKARRVEVKKLNDGKRTQDMEVILDKKLKFLKNLIDKRINNGEIIVDFNTRLDPNKLALKIHELYGHIDRYNMPEAIASIFDLVENGELDVKDLSSNVKRINDSDLKCDMILDDTTTIAEQLEAVAKVYEQRKKTARLTGDFIDTSEIIIKVS